ncbi:hypothetical protein J6590_038333 [Homalodisca vitripennis]|nr:hypothetical protein J6590_038333 [Homalodisca vitripennis]
MPRLVVRLDMSHTVRRIHESQYKYAASILIRPTEGPYPTGTYTINEIETDKNNEKRSTGSVGRTAGSGQPATRKYILIDVNRQSSPLSLSLAWGTRRMFSGQVVGLLLWDVYLEPSAAVGIDSVSGPLAGPWSHPRVGLPYRDPVHWTRQHGRQALGGRGTRYHRQ